MPRLNSNPPVVQSSPTVQNAEDGVELAPLGSQQQSRLAGGPSNTPLTQAPPAAPQALHRYSGRPVPRHIHDIATPGRAALGSAKATFLAANTDPRAVAARAVDARARADNSNARAVDALAAATATTGAAVTASAPRRASVPPTSRDQPVHTEAKIRANMDRARALAREAAAQNAAAEAAEAAAAQPSRLERAVGWTDIASFFNKGQSDYVLKKMRGTYPHEEGKTNFPALLNNLQAFQNRAHAALSNGAIDPNHASTLIKAFDSALGKIRSSIDGINDKASPETNIKRSLLLGAAYVLASGLMAAVPALTTPPQRSYLAQSLMLSGTAMIEGIAMSRMGVVDLEMAKDRMNARFMVNVAQAIYFIGALVKPELEENIPYAYVGAALVSLGVLFALNMGKETHEFVAKGVGQNPFRMEHAAANTLPDDVKGTLQTVLKEVSADADRLSETRGSMEEDFHVNELVAKRLSLVSAAYENSVWKLSRILGEDPPAPPSSNSSLLTAAPDADAGNPDATVKHALTLATVLATACATGGMYPDKMGVVDLASDGVFTAALQHSLAINPNMSKADAAREFKTFSGSTVVLAAALLGDKALSAALGKGALGLIGESNTSMAVGAAIMLSLNLTIPGVVGDTAARLMVGIAEGTPKVYEKMCACLGQMGRALPDPATLAAVAPDSSAHSGVSSDQSSSDLYFDATSSDDENGGDIEMPSNQPPSGNLNPAPTGPSGSTPVGTTAPFLPHDPAPPGSTVIAQIIASGNFGIPPGRDPNVV